MTTNVTFEVLINHKYAIQTIPIEHPEFEVIPPVVFQGIELPETSIEEQVICWLCEQDKSQLMEDNDWDLIIDYYILDIKSEEEEIKKFLEYSSPFLSPDLERPFSAVCSECKDLLFGQGKSNLEKFEIVIKLINMCNKISLGTLQMIINSTKKYIE